MWKRTINHYADGVKTIIHGDRESWTRYVIIPRHLAIRAIRRLRKKGGFQFHDCDWWHFVPAGLLGYCYDGGPGRAFAHEPFPWKTRNRRYLVYSQSGGLDV